MLAIVSTFTLKKMVFFINDNEISPHNPSQPKSLQQDHVLQPSKSYLSKYTKTK